MNRDRGGPKTTLTHLEKIKIKLGGVDVVPKKE